MAIGDRSFRRIFSVVLITALIFGLWLAITNSAHGGIAFFYAVPVGLATWWFGWKAGVLTSILTLGLYSIGITFQPVDEFWFTLLTRAVAFGLVVVLIASVRERQVQLEQSAEELEVITAALTPDALPHTAGLDVATAFVPSHHGVSGDFYLVASSPGGGAVVVLGDVVGHGPVAARLATFIRARLATFAANISDPVAILQLANDALIERSGMSQELVSAVCMEFDQRGGELRCAVAGHPPPLRLPDLVPMEPVGPTSLLGIRRPLAVSTVTVGLTEPGGVLAFTDGATDLRRDGALLGLDGLTAALAPHSDLSAKALATEAKASLLEIGDDPIPDDLCLVVMRPTSGELGVRTDIPARTTTLRRSARPDAVTELRWAAHDFALENGADEGLAGDIMLAVSEAVTNAVKHAYPRGEGEVELVASLAEGGRLVVLVRDSGGGFGPTSSEGLGAGLMLMRECADELDVDQRPTGVTVRMVFELRRPQP
ncbi:MAG TPA: SpoIIE family protein phosphatase [Solirubrobacterales bacterium]|nr:SpoIIE family protein phosphatase [Solirubrobacterales bacterium]